MRKTRSGFTLIEVLTAIAIILVLVGLLYVGLGKLTAPVKSGATRQTMENARVMLADLDSLTRLSRVPLRYWWSGASVDPSTLPSCDFWRTPYRSPLSAPPAGVPLPIINPGNVNADSPNRGTSDAVRNTGIAFDMMLALPQIKTMLAKLPVDQMRVATTEWAAGSYTAGQRVRRTVGANAPRYWECLANTSTTPGGADWKEAESSLLDAWNNPLIFVPSSGLGGVNVGDQTNMVIRSTGVYTNADATSAAGRPATTADRPFFASGGPDGNLTTGDDNVYSFEN